MVIPLQENQTHMLHLEGQRTMNVTLINANHCPGAVMFLWQGDFGTILYTGDFRFHPGMISGSPLTNVEVDTLLLDNTYLDPRFNFPSQTEALQQILSQLAALPDLGNYTILVGIDSLGKEQLLVDLAKHFRTKVEVPHARYECLKAIHRHEGFSDEEFSGKDTKLFSG